MKTTEKVRRLFADIDSKDSAAFASYLTQDASFAFGNAAPVQGRDNIQAAVEGFFGAIQGLSHQIDHIWEVPGHVVCTGMVTYTRLDGRTVQVPFCDVFDLVDELIGKYAIYIDITPLFA